MGLKLDSLDPDPRSRFNIVSRELYRACIVNSQSKGQVTEFHALSRGTVTQHHRAAAQHSTQL